MSSALAGCIPLATAKVIDVFGRVEGFFLMLLIVLVGMALKAACDNVQTYIAGSVLYWGGHIGVLYVTDVMAADITSLKNRMIIFTINGTPRIASAFAGPAIADLFRTKGNWRWAFGAFIIIFTAFSVPAMAVMIYMFRKAKAAGVIQKQKSGRNAFQSISYYFVQFDSKYSSAASSKVSLTNYSLWYHLDYGCVLLLPFAIHAQRVCTQAVGNTLHYRHDRPGYLALPGLHLLGGQDYSCSLPAMEIS